MDSKQLSELLVAKRIEAGLSVEQLAEKMGVTPYVVKDIEIGVYNSNMENTMKYISALNLMLVFTFYEGFGNIGGYITFARYRDLAKWCAENWPRYYQFKEGTLDVEGNRRFYVYGRGVGRGGITRQNLLYLCRLHYLNVDVLNEQQLNEKKAKLSALEKSNKQSDIDGKACAPIAAAMASMIVIIWCVALYKIGMLICTLSDKIDLYLLNLLVLTIGIGIIFVLLPITILPVFAYSFPFCDLLLVELVDGIRKLFRLKANKY